MPNAHLTESSAGAKEAEISPQAVYARDTTWIRACDVLIAEVSVPSHGVGYEIGYALGLGKPVLVLHQDGRKVSKMISGNPDSKLTMVSYSTHDEAVEKIHQYLKKMNGQ
ncbi:MAG TPA: nucleoside 2-deoxyribosyltransferase [Anaerolineales bacterium]|nr:nucleoside 2-deoxyribosyltransferase [Anaerolineales bacterium]